MVRDVQVTFNALMFPCLLALNYRTKGKDRKHRNDHGICRDNPTRVLQTAPAGTRGSDVHCVCSSRSGLLPSFGALDDEGGPCP